MEARYLFGPVRSRRFGLSLGIDLSPRAKQCNFDCLYCELKGAKAQESMHEVVEVEAILEELRAQLPHHPALDVITVTANGEPTLYPHLLPLIRGIKQIPHTAKTLILSNGSRFGEASVQEALLEFDIVKFSLDAVSERTFRRVDRAIKGLEAGAVVEGIKRFARRFKGELIAEVLVVAGVNDSVEEMEAVAKTLREINPLRVDLGTIDRPPAYKVQGVTPERLQELAECFDGLNLFITKRQKSEGNGARGRRFSKEELLRTLERRPWSEDDARELLNEESRRFLEELVDEGLVIQEFGGKILFYRAKVRH